METTPGSIAMTIEVGRKIVLTDGHQGIIKYIDPRKEVVNEYSKEEKIKTLETIIMMQKIKGTDSMVDWLGKLKKLQENAENFII